MQLVSYKGRNGFFPGNSPVFGPGNAYLASLPLGSDFGGSLGRSQLMPALGLTGNTVGAIVTYDDPSETARKYARYELRVNGLLQAGG